MKALMYDSFQQPLQLVDLPDPSPAPDGVVIEVKASGICRSDWHGWMGHDSDIHLPHVPGHELAGVVLATGAQVERVAPGDRVTVPFSVGCGKCEQCSAGHQQICDHYFQPGFTAWGSFAEYVHIRYADVNLVKLPDSMSFVEAASLGCRFITSYRAVVAQGRLAAGEWLAVHGCGGVGLSAIMIGKALGARVIAVDIEEEKLAMAKELGAEIGLNARKTDSLTADILDQTHGGVHVSIDGLGSHETCRNSVLSLRKRGRHVQVGLLAGDQADPPLPMGRVISHELELLGSHGMQAHQYPTMMDMIVSGQLSPSQLVGKCVSLEEAKDELEHMDHFAHTGMVVIDRF
ncbi:MAG: zinc-dependent alcohol dehydrogenase family protein [Bacteroidota bacterium]